MIKSPALSVPGLAGLSVRSLPAPIESALAADQKRRKALTTVRLARIATLIRNSEGWITISPPVAISQSLGPSRPVRLARVAHHGQFDRYRAHLGGLRQQIAASDEVKGRGGHVRPELIAPDASIGQLASASHGLNSGIVTP